MGFLFRALGARGRTNIGRRTKAGIAASLVGGAILVALGLILYSNLQTKTEIATGTETVAEATPAWGSAAVIVLGGYAGAAGACALLWWVAFRLIPALLARGRSKR